MARLLLMPAVAANAVEAVLSDWPLPEGGTFASGDPLATVETEKAVVDVPAEAPGVLVRTLVAIGADVRVGAPIALLADPGETIDDPDAVLDQLGAGTSGAAGAAVAAVGGGTGAAGAGETATDDAHPAAAPAPVRADETTARIFSSPLARRLAREAGLALADLVGSGPGGRVVRRDVERARAARDTRDQVPAHAAPSSAPAPATTPVPATAAGPAAVALPRPDTGAAGYTDVPHTRMRRAIAERLGRSVHEAPHFAVQGTARVERLLELRAQLNGYGGPKISVNDLVVLAAARAHVLVPAMNVVWLPDAVRRFSGVDVAVAVSTDRGLVTPVLRGLDRMSITAVAAASADLVGRARAGTLRDDELVGGTLTVTNLGPYGTEAFTAIINPPQAAILAVGAARQEAVVRDGELEVGTVMHATLAVDHRPVDGAVAAEWMAAFLALVEEPVRILA